MELPCEPHLSQELGKGTEKQKGELQPRGSGNPEEIICKYLPVPHLYVYLFWQRWRARVVSKGAEHEHETFETICSNMVHIRELAKEAAGDSLYITSRKQKYFLFSATIVQ